MAIVHIFISSSRFRSFEELRRFIDVTYTEDGEVIPSPFLREVGLSGYEPGCIEAINSDRPAPLSELLAGASYSEQWLDRLTGRRSADAAVCVYEPNEVRHPEGCSLEYCGRFEYKP